MRIALVAKLTFGPNWVRASPKTLRNLKIHRIPGLSTIASKAHAKDLRKLHHTHAKGFFVEKWLPVEFVFREMPFHG